MIRARASNLLKNFGQFPRQFYVFGFTLGRQHTADEVEGLGWVKGSRVELEDTIFDLLEVKQVVDAVLRLVELALDQFDLAQGILFFIFTDATQRRYEAANALNKENDEIQGSLHLMTHH